MTNNNNNQSTQQALYQRLIDGDQIESENLIQNNHRASDCTTSIFDSSLIYNSLKSTIPIMLALDNELNVLLLGILLTRLGYNKSAPLITTSMSIVFYIQAIGHLPVILDLARISDQVQTSNNAPTPGTLLLNGFMTSTLYWAIIIPALCFSKNILILLGQEQTIAEQTQDFLRIFSGFFLAFSPHILGEYYLLSIDKLSLVMRIALASLFMTGLLECGVVFDWFSTNHSTHSTAKKSQNLAILSGVNIVLTSIGYLMATLNKLAKTKQWQSKIDYQQITHNLFISLPNILASMTDIVISFILSIFAGWLGSKKLAKQNLAILYLTLNYLITNASTQTMALFIQKQYDHSLSKIVFSVNLATLLLQLIPALLVTATADLFISMIKNTPDQETRLLLLFTVIYALLDGVRLNLLQALRSCDQHYIPSISSSLLLIIGVGLSAYLSQYSTLGLIGLPIGMSLSASVCLAPLGYLLARTEKPIKKTTGAKDTNIAYNSATGFFTENSEEETLSISNNPDLLSTSHSVLDNA